MTFGFAHPFILLLLLLIPAYAYLHRGRSRAFIFSRASTAGALSGGAGRWLARLPGWLRSAAVALLIIALAAPRTGAAAINIDAEGIAIVIAIDVSSSMGSEDFKPHNRLEVAKQKVASFIQGRAYDRIGLVTFAGEALTQVPLTVDYDVLYEAVDQMRLTQNGMLEDGTAIGTAIATSANRLRRVPGKSHVMVLMTDGENNRGDIDPLTAARAAQAYGIKIYTIGVGSEGMAPVPTGPPGQYGTQYQMLPVHIDEELLGQIATMTGGHYFRATNAQALDSIYHQIDTLEKSTVDVTRYVNYTPRFLSFVIAATLSLMLELLLLSSRFGRIP
jgi:Ca-activated chloride channel family protein